MVGAIPCLNVKERNNQLFRYTPISIVFVVLLLASILQVQYEGDPWWIIPIPVVLFVIIISIGSFKISLNFYLKSLIKSNTNEKIIALTFDDGPDARVTPQLLNLLESEDTPATFFCIGKQIEKYPEVIKAIDQKGHLIGNHSYSHHHWFSFFSSKKMETEIKRTNELIQGTINKSPTLFRPPFGVTNPNLKQALTAVNMYSTGWSLRSFDTIKNTDDVIRKLIRKTKPGDVVLFHDNNEKIIEIVTTYLKWLKENGFKVVSLEQLFNIKAYEAN